MRLVRGEGGRWQLATAEEVEVGRMVAVDLGKEGVRPITRRDLSNGKMLVPEPPGVQVRRHLFEERDHNT